MDDIKFFTKQQLIALRNKGLIDPENIDHYIARDGYKALKQVLEDKNPQSVIDEVKASAIRGRGGGGFPTGVKWESGYKAAQEREEEIYIVCNADEGDPGAYMDRTILESNPHQLLEGMAICAHAIGAEKGIIYVRAEYPLAVDIITRAIKQAEELGFLGKNVLSSSCDLEISLFQGSGAFVCGDETALIRSIEGYRGMPRHRPPYPVERGIWGMPTVINNVKTLATVPAILENGAKWYQGSGNKDSSDTAIFSVVGNVTHPGLVEIPMGETLRNLVFDTCGGIPDRKQFKALQIGGPSGGCLPEEFLDTPIDFDSLQQAGAMMGSGGMVVMDEDS